jgi:hypothetical protein
MPYIELIGAARDPNDRADASHCPRVRAPTQTDANRWPSAPIWVSLLEMALAHLKWTDANAREKSVLNRSVKICVRTLTQRPDA